ncbi:MAG: hypothetical protein ACRD23_14410, partial [Terriglobales bacterium]
IIVNPDLQGPVKQPPLSAEAARKAMAAGVKPAALITHISTSPKPSLSLKPVRTSVAKPSPSRPAARVRTAKAGHRKPHVRQARARTVTKAKAKPGTASLTGKNSATKSAAAVKPAKPSPAIAKGEPE